MGCTRLAFNSKRNINYEIHSAKVATKKELGAEIKAVYFLLLFAFMKCKMYVKTKSVFNYELAQQLQTNYLIYFARLHFRFISSLHMVLFYISYICLMALFLWAFIFYFLLVCLSSRAFTINNLLICYWITVSQKVWKTNVWSINLTRKKSHSISFFWMGELLCFVSTFIGFVRELSNVGNWDQSNAHI